MRKFLSRSIVLAAMTAVLLAATAAAAGAIGTGVVDADALRVRSEASTDASTITYLSDGTQVQVLEDLGGWYRISWGGYTGYVSAEYLIYTPASTETSADAAPLQRDVTGRTAVLEGDGAYFRAGPSVADDVYDVMAAGDEVTILSVEDGWCQVEWDRTEGYIKADYLSVDGIPLVDPQGVVSGDCVNLRSGPGTSNDVLAKVYGGTLVNIITLEDGWYAVEYNGITGYIREDYLRIYDGSDAGSGVGASIVETALSFLGTPYSYGGASPRGFDCSGFTMYVFSLHGYSLPHSATSQWNSSGTYVDKSDLQPGDLVLFCDPSRSNGKACSHVGIYIGDNEFVHASSGSRSGKYVRTNSLSESYYSGYYVGAKRVA